MDTDYSWIPDWSNDVCVLAACGPSLTKEQIAVAAHYYPRIVVINRAYELAPYADVLYACDPKFWEYYFKNPEAKRALLVSQYQVNNEGIATARDHASKGVHYLRLHHDNETRNTRGHTGSGANSGFQALNFVLHTGCKKVVLLGYDMNYTAQLHWHGPHKPPLVNPSPEIFRRWRTAFEESRPQYRAAKMKIVNCSPTTKLNAFTKMPLEQALKEFTYETSIPDCS